MMFKRIAPGLALLTSLVLAKSAPAQRVSLEALQRDGYGVVTVQRPRPNVLVVNGDVGGRRMRLLVNTSWTGEGVGAFDNAAAGTAADVRLGNVQLARVPVSAGAPPPDWTPELRRATGATGVIGAAFLRNTSAIIDTQNLQLYLRPPGRGRRAVLGPAMAGAGLAQAAFEMSSRQPLIDVQVNGVSGRMVVDTGAFHAAVDRRLTRKIGARPIVTRAGHRRPQTQDEFEQLTRVDRTHREVAGLVENTPMTPLRSFTIGGVPVRAPDIRLRDQPAGAPHIGSLGMDILGSNGAIIDFAGQQLYFFRATGQTTTR
jgi:hypothetical protein